MTTRHIVITGATKGIGKALVLEWAKAGHRISCCGRSSDKVAELKAQLTDEYAIQCCVEVVDVADAEAVSRWAETAIAICGTPDVLFNNAAVINKNAPLIEVPQREFDQLIDVNIKGVANVIRAFAPAMIEKQQGVILNMSSGWGRGTSPDVAPYCASKYAIEGLTKAFAQELPEGMAAIPLSPNTVNTEMLQSCFGAGAGYSPTADEWAKTVAPWILALNATHNGESLSTPV